MGINIDAQPPKAAGAIMYVIDEATGQELVGDDGTKISLTIVGEDSREYIEAQYAIMDRNLEARARGRNIKPSAERYDDEMIELMAACTIGWTGFYSGGAPAAPTKENIIKVYKGWRSIYRQALEFRQDRANFLKA